MALGADTGDERGCGDACCGLSSQRAVPDADRKVSFCPCSQTVASHLGNPAVFMAVESRNVKSFLRGAVGEELPARLDAYAKDQLSMGTVSWGLDQY